jgi:hypothetical protein
MSPFSKFDVPEQSRDNNGDMTEFSISPADTYTKPKADPWSGTAFPRGMSASLRQIAQSQRLSDSIRPTQDARRDQRTTARDC